MKNIDLHTFANMCDGAANYYSGKPRAEIIYGREKTNKSNHVTIKGAEER